MKCRDLRPGWRLLGPVRERMRARTIDVVEGDLEHAYDIVTQVVDRLAVWAAQPVHGIDPPEIHAQA